MALGLGLSAVRRSCVQELRLRDVRLRVPGFQGRF